MILSRLFFFAQPKATISGIAAGLARGCRLISGFYFKFEKSDKPARVQGPYQYRIPKFRLRIPTTGGATNTPRKKCSLELEKSMAAYWMSIQGLV